MFEKSLYFESGKIRNTLNYEVSRKLSLFLKVKWEAKREVLMNLSAETPGCLEIDPDTSEHHRNCVYSKLIVAGFSWWHFVALMREAPGP